MSKVIFAHIKRFRNVSQGRGMVGGMVAALAALLMVVALAVSTSTPATKTTMETTSGRPNTPQDTASDAARGARLTAIRERYESFKDHQGDLARQSAMPLPTRASTTLSDRYEALKARQIADLERDATPRVGMVSALRQRYAAFKDRQGDRLGRTPPRGPSTAWERYVEHKLHQGDRPNEP